ncbi:MAG: polysaccharide deacetylase family protein [Actinomycetota bacterium]
MLRPLALLLILLLGLAAACAEEAPAPEGEAGASDGAAPAEATGAEAAGGGQADGPGADGDEAGADRDGPGTEREEPGGDGEDGTPPDPAEVGANELGMVPVLMYHRIVEDPAGVYDRTPEGFRAELDRLFADGYRPVTVADLAAGEIDVPAGTSPVALTFDDATREQAALDEDGSWAADTAVGILTEVARDHDVEPTASFYVNADPFGGGADSERILARLHDEGYELGNHTATHRDLSTLTAEEVAGELAAGVRVITDVVDAEVATMSLPLGRWPDPREPAYAGEADGVAYAHEAVLLVGADPAPSPFSADFDARAVPRIRSQALDPDDPESQFASEFWLDWLDDDPDRRYVADGDPRRVSFPADLAERLDPGQAAGAQPYER